MKTIPLSEKKKLSNARYDAKTARRYGFKLNKGTDADIIAKLDSVPSMQGYIKALIRADIAKNDK